MYQCVVKERDRCRETRETETERDTDRWIYTHTENDCIVYAVKIRNTHKILNKSVTKHIHRHIL